MGTTTTTFALNKPTVGGDDNAWGTDWNTNADKIDDLLDGTTAIKPNLTEGQWKVGGVAVTASAAELNYVDGVTSAIQTQIDGKQALDADLTAIAGLSANGMIARTGAGTAAARTVTAGAGITITNGDGVSGNPTVAATLASQAQAEAGTDNTTLMTPLRVTQAARPVLGTSVASTSGTAIDFTGIPSWAKRISVMFSGFSTNGSSVPIIQLGDIGGFEVSGYLGSAISNATPNVFTTGAAIAGIWGATAVVHGCVQISLQVASTNTWVIDGTLGQSDGAGVLRSGFSKSLSAALDRIRITTVNGTDTFDDGTISIMWE